MEKKIDSFGSGRGEGKDRTNTVAHPGTVVVKLGDAAVAHGAVFGPDGLPYLGGDQK